MIVFSLNDEDYFELFFGARFSLLLSRCRFVKGASFWKKETGDLEGIFQ